MKQLSIIVMILLMVTVTGCSKKDIIKHNYTYKGENEFWDAEFIAKGTVTSEEKDGKLDIESESINVLTITYRKDLSDLASVKHLEISCEASLCSANTVMDYCEGGEYHL